jgi:hypothetical protein
MLIEKRINLQKEKRLAKKAIDEKAEEIRGLFLTPGSGQAMVYTEKLKEAEAYMANQSISLNEIAHIATEAASDGTTIFNKAVEVITLAYQWKIASSIIENIRLEAKKSVNNQTDYLVIRSMPKNVDWSPVLQYVQ